MAIGHPTERIDRAGLDLVVRSIYVNEAGDGFSTDTVRSSSGQHLVIQSGTSGTDIAGKTVRLNSLTSTGTANSFIGFQSKPGIGATTTKELKGGEISPRVNDTFGASTVIGLHADVYLKGTTGNLSGSVRALQLELVTDDAGTRTITGDVVGIRMRAAFSGTITGDMVAIRIEKAEAQTNSNQWEYVLELTDTVPLVWNNAPGTEPSTADGYLKVRVNDADRWIQLYSSAPVD